MTRLANGTNYLVQSAAAAAIVQTDMKKLEEQVIIHGGYRVQDMIIFGGIKGNGMSTIGSDKEKWLQEAISKIDAMDTEEFESFISECSTPQKLSIDY